MNINWLWARKGTASAPSHPPSVEQKMGGYGGYGFVQLEQQSSACWTRRDSVSLINASYLKNPIAYRAVRLISESVADIPWILRDGSSEIDQHPLLELLQRPNGRQSRSAFLEKLVMHLLLTGNAYLERIGDDAFSELHLLRPDHMSLHSDLSGWPIAMVWRSGASRRVISLEGEGGEGARACHMMYDHPLDDIYGFAPLQAAAMAIDVHNSANEWNKALIDNSARPSGALVYAPKAGGNLSSDQFDRLKTELQEGYQGARQAGRPLLLEGGLDWKPMGLTPKDMDFFEAKNAAARDIALAFGVPPLMLGLPGDATYANYSEANKAFFRLTVLPLANRIAATFSNWLTPLYGEDLRLVINADGVDALGADRAAMWSRVTSADFLTENEKREAVGYEALHNTRGDV
jgi:HK97 family phage portal protein